MLPSQKEPRDKSVSPELDVQKMSQSTVAAETAALSNQSILATPAKAVAQFRYRILVVDDEPSIRETAGPFWEARVMRFSQQRTGWMAYTRSASPCPM
jgi:hypothetical protein